MRELVQLWEARACGPPRQAGASVEGPAVPSSPTPEAGGEGEGVGVVLAVAGLLPPSPPPEDVPAQPAASEPPEVDASGGQATRLWPAAAPGATLRKDVVLPAWLRALVRKGVRARARDRARMRMGWLRAALAPARGQAAVPAATPAGPAVAGAPRTSIAYLPGGRDPSGVSLSWGSSAPCAGPGEGVPGGVCGQPPGGEEL